MLVVHGNESRPTSVTGIDNRCFEARDWKQASGQTFSDAELRSGRPVCVIGATVRKELFKQEPPLAATIRIGKISCEVVGILDSKGASFVNHVD